MMVASNSSIQESHAFVSPKDILKLYIASVYIFMLHYSPSNMHKGVFSFI